MLWVTHGSEFWMLSSLNFQYSGSKLGISSFQRAKWRQNTNKTSKLPCCLTLQKKSPVKSGFDTLHGGQVHMKLQFKHISMWAGVGRFFSWSFLWIFRVKHNQQENGLIFNSKLQRRITPQNAANFMLSLKSHLFLLQEHDKWDEIMKFNTKQKNGHRAVGPHFIPQCGRMGCTHGTM